MTDNSTYTPPADYQPVIGTANPHVKALADVFEIMFAGNGEAKRLAESRIPKNLSVDIGDKERGETKIVNARELVLSEGIAATPLVQLQYFNTVMEGARLVQCARSAIRSERMTKGNTIRLPFQSTRAGRAPEVPEGAPFRNSNGTYTYRDFKVKKYGEVAPITDEMISDGLYNTMALEVGLLGEHCENALNYEAIGAILENSGKEYDTAGTSANQGIKAIASAKLELQGAARSGGGFRPDTVIATTDFDTNLNKEFLLTNYHGGQTVVNGGTPPALGMRYFVTNTDTSSTTYTWGYITDGYIGALVLNQMSAGAYVMRDDITVEDFKEPLQDLTTAKAKIRFAVNYGIANAACRIKY